MLSHSRFYGCAKFFYLSDFNFVSGNLSAFLLCVGLSTVCRRRETHADKETAPTGVKEFINGILERFKNQEKSVAASLSGS